MATAKHQVFAESWGARRFQWAARSRQYTPEHLQLRRLPAFGWSKNLIRNLPAFTARHGKRKPALWPAAWRSTIGEDKPCWLGYSYGEIAGMSRRTGIRSQAMGARKRKGSTKA